MDIKETLFIRASQIRLNAYAPYSNYQVGAALCSESGEIYTSCNVENISFPCGTCAEAGAIASMIAGGDKKITAILIVADGEDLVYPCGACLQRIAEFSDNNTRIFLASADGIKKEYIVSELLPHNFKTSELTK